MLVLAPKWVRKAGCYVVTTIEEIDSLKKKSSQKQYWLSTHKEAIIKYKELT